MEVKFNDVSYVVNGEKIIDGISFELQDGKINALIGANGSGKTILGKMLNGMLYPTSGNICIGKITISNIPLDNIEELQFNVGYVYQLAENQFFCESVKDEIGFELNRFSYRKKEYDKHISDALKMVGLSDEYLNRDPFSLSSGEKQKVALASILSINPEIIILDEPTNGLDYQDKLNLVRLLKKIKRRYKKTIIIISCDVEFVHLLADYVFVIDKGRLILKGDKYAAFSNMTILKKCGLVAPQIVTFKAQTLQRKKIKLVDRDDINDLIKDILRNI